MNNPSTIPPRWPLKLLSYLLKDSYLEEIEGDMEERFQDNLERYNLKKARRLYVWDSFKLPLPGLWHTDTKKHFTFSKTTIKMENYIYNLSYFPATYSVSKGLCATDLGTGRFSQK